MKCYFNIIQHNKFQMRMQYRKTRSNPFSSMKQKLKNPHLAVDLGQSDGRQKEKGEIIAYVRNKSQRKVRDGSLNMKASEGGFKESAKEIRSKRTLVDENQQLKKKLQTLLQNRTSRKGSFAKKMSTQFEKEIYWAGSQSYMISGIKLQYQKMKENFHKKAEDYDELMRSALVTNNMEFLSYIEALEVQNHILSKQALSSSSIQHSNIEMYRHISSLQQALSKQKQKAKKRYQEVKQLRRKVAFLEKLIISKDNNEHAAIRNVRKVQRQDQELKKKILDYEQLLTTMLRQHTGELQRLTTAHRDALELQLSKQASSQKEQVEHLTRIQRENRYLQGLVDSWKAERLHQKEVKQPKDSHHHHHHSSSHHRKLEREAKQSQIIRQTPRKIVEKEKQIVNIDLKKAQQDQQMPQRSEPYTADHKNSENSVKNRRVQIYQVEQIVEISRFRLVAKGLDLQWLIELFGCDPEDEWNFEYINMGETRQIIEKNLCVSKDQALTFSRYLIEHSHNQFVFTDDLNEYSRSVVKSILRNLYGKYSIFSQEKQQFTQILSTARDKLEWLLVSTTKGGLISKQKFGEVLQSLTLTKPGFDTYCIAKMALHSQNLQKLQFKYLFQS